MEAVQTESNMGGVIRVARPSIRRAGFVRRIVDGTASLLKGMAVTIRYLVRPSTIVTRQYPENRETLRMFDRYRTQLVMSHDEQGYHKCTACRQCVLACPNASILITTRKGAVSGRNELDQYVWRHDSCTFCNACVIVCPFGALEMSPKFESAVFDRRLLVYNLNRYAGPPASVLLKAADDEQRKSMMEPRGVYSGPLPLNGVSLAGANAALAEPGANDQRAPAASGQKEQG